MTFSPDPQDTWQGPRVRMRNLLAFKIIGAIGAERRAKGGALFHIKLYDVSYITALLALLVRSWLRDIRLSSLSKAAIMYIKIF